MKWQPIETAPKDGPVLLYFANRKFHHPDGTPASMGEVRGYVERTEVGFCENGEICESGTGHDVFEEWRGPENLPTHWMPLPEPPGRVAMSSEIPYTSIGDGPMTDHTAPELKPCPFCGDVPRLDPVRCGSGLESIECVNDKCLMQPSTGYVDFEVSIAAWNTRADMHRAHTEAAVRRALEEAATKVDAFAAMVQIGADACRETHPSYADDRDGYADDARDLAAAILALDHAQFIGDEE
jgi:hypothetical protein